jgi:hypothetical protein
MLKTAQQIASEVLVKLAISQARIDKAMMDRMNMVSDRIYSAAGGPNVNSSFNKSVHDYMAAKYPKTMSRFLTNQWSQQKSDTLNRFLNTDVINPLGADDIAANKRDLLRNVKVYNDSPTQARRALKEVFDPRRSQVPQIKDYIHTFRPQPKAAPAPAPAPASVPAPYRYPTWKFPGKIVVPPVVPSNAGATVSQLNNRHTKIPKWLNTKNVRRAGLGLAGAAGLTGLGAAVYHLRNKNNQE